MTTIDGYAFANCTSIDSVKFGASLTFIGYSAFNNCANAFAFAFAGAPLSADSSAFKNVKSGAIGTYTAEHKAAWDAVIGADGKWNGLIMKANKPIVSNGGCNVAAGTFTLNWGNSDAPMPSAMTYEIRRGFSDNYGASEVLTNGYNGLSFVDPDFYTTGGVSRIWYWVTPEHQLFEPSEPIVTRTRHAIVVGLGKWDPEVWNNVDTGGATNARHFADLALSSGGFLSENVHRCIDSNAKTNDVSVAFDSVACAATPGDICVFFINTHGGNENGEASLALYDESYTDQQLSADIAKLQTVSRGLAVIGIVSACHSGALFDNPEMSASNAEWYLDNGLAMCSPNVAWITSSDALHTSYGIFSKFLLKYGWEDQWAECNGAMTFLDLGLYAKRQYDAIFKGIKFLNEYDYETDAARPRTVQILNDQLLSRIAVRTVSNIHGGENAPVAPTISEVSKATYKNKITASWNAVPNADDYVVFVKFGTEECWYETWYDEDDFTVEFHVDKNTPYYDFFMRTSKDLPAYFAVRSYNGAGVSELSPLRGGWIDSSWSVIFDAGEGRVVGAWQGMIAGPLDTRFKKTMARGERFLVGTLPDAVRDGFTRESWVRSDGRVATTNTVVLDDITYKAKWTAMTTNYLNQHPPIATASGGDIATAARMIAANGCRTVGECYALGIDPEDPNDDLKITHFEMGKDGKPVITLNHTEDGSGNSFLPRAKTLGKATLSNAEEWREVPEGGDSSMRFFKVDVELP